MSIGHQLSVCCEALHRRLLEHYIVTIDVFAGSGFEHKKCAIDPPFSRLRLLIENCDAIAFKFNMSVPRGRSYRRHCCQFSMRAMKGKQAIKINIGHTITPC